jgi:fermentation-respiration switch protein FrsA (DUF1100 family)
MIDRRQLLIDGGLAATGLALAGRIAAQPGVELHRVVFRASDGTKLVGHLRRPAGRERPRAAVLVPTTMTGAKDQSVVVNYAEGLAHAGFVTLVFDQRNFGESGGRPRAHEDIHERLADLRAAVSYLASLTRTVDPARIGGLGVSIGGGLVMALTAFDPRVRAFVAIAAGLTDPFRLRDALGAEAYAAQLERLAAIAQRSDLTGHVEYVPVVTPDGVGALFPSPDAYAYYGTARGASRWWRNRATALSLRTLLIHDVLTPAALVGPRAGLLIVGAGDQSTPPAWHQDAYDRLTGPKRLLVLDGAAHNDLYDDSAYVSRAVDAASAWLREHLS